MAAFAGAAQGKYKKMRENLIKQTQCYFYDKFYNYFAKTIRSTCL